MYLNNLNTYFLVYCLGFAIGLICVVLIGDADDTVNTELATAGNGEVVGNMCNRSRYVLRYYSRAPAFSQVNLRWIDLACQCLASGNVSHFSCSIKFFHVEDVY